MTRLLTFLLMFLLTFLPTFLLTFLLTFLPTFPLTFLPSLLEQIESTTRQVGEIFHDLAGLISSQSEAVESISSAIAYSSEKTIKGNDQLKMASRRSTRSRTRTAMLTAGVVAATILLLLSSMQRVG